MRTGIAGGKGATGTRLPWGRGEKVAALAIGGQKTAAMETRSSETTCVIALICSIYFGRGVLAGWLFYKEQPPHREPRAIPFKYT